VGHVEVAHVSHVLPDGRQLLGDASFKVPDLPAGLGEAAPDGICVDAENAVWYAEVPGKRCARVAEGGAELQTVPLDRGGFACVLGGEDRTTLYITAAEWRGMTDAQMVAAGSGQVLAIDVDVPGAGWP
jgi:sugar lactone lactonase YvrE